MAESNEKPVHEAIAAVSTGSRSDSSVEYFVLASLPKEARAVLVVGEDAGTLSESLRQERRTKVTALDVNGAGCEWEAALEGALADGPLDCIVCTDVLSRLREPASFLRRCHQALSDGGVLLVRAANIRHHSTVTALLYGTWPHRADGLVAHDPVRFFTRRELEKLLFRSGFRVSDVDYLGNGDLAAWRTRGRPGEVKTGQIHIAGLREQDAQEFHAEACAVSARKLPWTDYGLTSIVLVTHNQLAYTRGCLESIRFHTDEPFELIVVDNASTDGTVDYLRACGDVRLIENGDNRGFPAAANQGIEASKGEQILLLNNDTLVTTGWLERMLAALRSDPKVGLVGPCSNYVSGQQQVAVSYQDLMDLDGFAWEWGKTHGRVRLDVDRLVGFCLLFRRALVDAIGLLDERFGIGNFEDDDYCVRARQAGFRAVFAKDAFVHHFGHRTFDAVGADLNAVLLENAQRFNAKWSAQGEEASARSGVAVVAKERTTPTFGIKAAENGGLLLVPKSGTVSLCMIVRDNEHTIRPCLESIRPWVDELIVVDTGSKDRTPEMCRELGATVYEFAWCDDFSAARNASLKYATGEWVFWMDSDDTISEENGRKLRELVTRRVDPTLLGYVMQVHCPGSGSDGDADMTVVDHVKLFRNLPSLRFEGRIHEQVLTAIRAAGGEVAWTDVFVVHSGADHTPEGRKRKLERDLRILDLDLAERPDHPFVLFNVGMTHADAKNYRAAVAALKRCLEVSSPQESHVRKAYALLVSSYFQLEEYDAAFEVCQKGRGLFTEDVELLFREGMLHHECGRLAESVASYEQALMNREERHFTSIDRGIVSYKARLNLAVVLTDMGRLERAEVEWRQVVEEMPHYRPGWRGLSDNLMRQGNIAEAERIAGRLLADARLTCEGLLARADISKARGDLEAAKHDLMAAVDCAGSDDSEPLRRLCQFLFECGEPLEAKEALERLTQCCPEDASAQHNLGTVCLQTGHFSEAIQAFANSLKLRPAYALTYLHLGYAHHACGSVSQAADAFSAALEVDPDLVEARHALQSVTAPRIDSGAMHPIGT